MKKLFALMLAVLLLASVLTGCVQKTAEAEPAASQTEGTEQPVEETAEAPAEETPAEETPAEEETEEPAEPALPDGVYTAEFNTDSSMFHANEACDGKGTLTVKDGQMTIHVSLVSKTILNLYPGLAEDAKAEGARAAPAHNRHCHLFRRSFRRGLRLRYSRSRARYRV